MIYVYRTADFEQVGTTYGIHQFEVEATSRAEARAKVSKLTKLPVTWIMTVKTEKD